MVHCLQCGNDLDPDGKGEVIASISGSIMGDEYTESFFFCPSCTVYTVEVRHEPFLNEDSVSFRGPVSKDEGDAAVALIRRCTEPWDKKCRCEAHCAYFQGQLD
jgi:hypothetical protein